MKLLIDSGNSFIKWAWFGGGQFIVDRCEAKSVSVLVNEWKGHAAPDRVFFANVAGTNAEVNIRNATTSLWKIEPEIIVSSKECCGLKNGYHQLEKLGVDRWLAMIAAYKMAAGPVIVIDAGSALTVDLVKSNGQFSGGVIMPGMGLAFRSLLSDTDIAYDIDRSGQKVDPFSLSTEDGVLAGVILGIAGGVEKVIRKMSGELEPKPVIYITGGDADKLLPYIDAHAVLQTGLVLEGLKIVIENERAHSK